MRVVLDTNCLIHADPDDNKFVDCAIAATARYVVSNDHHFDVLRLKKTFPTVDVINLKDFVELIHK
jgi:predicted nucleic acid-binding protein